jgi:large subunit ribosomal protein L29
MQRRFFPALRTAKRLQDLKGTPLMKFKEVSEMSSDELQTKKRDMRQESLHLRLQQQSGQLEQPSRLRLLRRDVARIETILSQRAAKAETAKVEKK